MMSGAWLSGLLPTGFCIPSLMSLEQNVLDSQPASLWTPKVGLPDLSLLPTVALGLSIVRRPLLFTTLSDRIWQTSIWHLLYTSVYMCSARVRACLRRAFPGSGAGQWGEASLRQGIEGCLAPSPQHGDSDCVLPAFFIFYFLDVGP